MGRAIRIDVNSDEVLMFPAVDRPLIHPYSDHALLERIVVPCYDLHEVLAEKVRAIAGQRRYAIARDLYDIAVLLQRHKVDRDALARVWPTKLEIKGLPVGPVDLSQWEERKPDYAADWQRNLVYLLVPRMETDFERVWKSVKTLLQELNDRLNR